MAMARVCSEQPLLCGGSGWVCWKLPGCVSSGVETWRGSGSSSVRRWGVYRPHTNPAAPHGASSHLFIASAFSYLYVGSTFLWLSVHVRLGDCLWEILQPFLIAVLLWVASKSPWSPHSSSTFTWLWESNSGLLRARAVSTIGLRASSSVLR